MNTEAVLLQKKLESLLTRIETEKQQIEKANSLTEHYKEEQLSLNQKLLLLNEEVNLLKETKASKPIEQLTNYTNERDKLKDYFKEVSKKDNTGQNNDEDYNVVYKIIQNYLENSYERINNVCYNRIPNNEKIVNIDTKCIAVYFLESVQDFETKNQRVQTFRMNSDSNLEDFIRASLNFWEVSVEYDRYEFYALDQNYIPQIIHEKYFDLNTELYYKSLGRVRLAKLFIIQKGEVKKFIDVYRDIKEVEINTKTLNVEESKTNEVKKEFISYFNGIERQINSRLEKLNQERAENKKNNANQDQNKANSAIIKQLFIVSEISVIDFILLILSIILLILTCVSLIGGINKLSIYENLVFSQGFKTENVTVGESDYNNTYLINVVEKFYNKSDLLNISPLRITIYSVDDKECDFSNNFYDVYKINETCTDFQLTKSNAYSEGVINSTYIEESKNS